MHKGFVDVQIFGITDPDGDPTLVTISFYDSTLP